MIRITSSRVSTARWYATRDMAESAYDRAARRRGIQPPVNYPGSAAGDLHEPGRVQGPRDGHGTIYVEVRP